MVAAIGGQVGNRLDFVGDGRGRIDDGVRWWPVKGWWSPGLAAG